MTRGTTGFSDDKYPEFWPIAVEHDIHYETELFGFWFDEEFVHECREVYAALKKREDSGEDTVRGHSARFQLGYQQYKWNSRRKKIISAEEADIIFNKYCKRVIRVTKDKNLKRQLRMARAQRMMFLNIPGPIKRAFLFINRLFRGA